MSLSKLPVFCIDSHVVTYNILQTVGYYAKSDPSKVFLPEGSEDTAIKYAHLAVDWVNNLGFISPENRPINAIVVWVVDSIPYWRAKIYPDYKGNRGGKHGFFWVIDAILRSKVNPLAVPTYEADDLAALFCKLWQKRTPKSVAGTLYLCTVDTDWMGLVGEDRVWLDLGGYNPRFRHQYNFYSWLEKKIDKLSKKNKLELEGKLDRNDPTSIWRYKAVAGDRSDNLPPGSSLDLIDLFAPPPDYRLWDNPAMVQLALKRLRVPRPLNFDYTFDLLRQMYLLGYEPPVKPIGDSLFAAKPLELV